MTTDVALLENAEYNVALLAMLGFGRSGGGDDGLTRLSINFDHVVEVEDENGNKEDVSLVAGCFQVRIDGENVYSMKNPVTFRPFMQRFWYSRYLDKKDDPEGVGGFVGQSILANNGEEPIDDQGTVACGKLRGKAAKGDLSDSQKKIQKEVNAYRVVFGTVTFKGKTATGKEVDVNNLPVQLRLRGNNFIPIGDVLKELEKRKVMPMTVELALKTRREKNGSTTYYIIEYGFDLAKRVNIGKDDIELVKQFQDHIQTFNASIREKHMEKLKKRSEIPFDTGLDDDFGIDPDDSGSEV